MSSTKAQRASSPTPATTLICVIQTKPALKKGIEKVDHGMVNSDRTMRCRSIGHASRSLHPPVRSNSKFLRRSILLSMLACNSHLREKLKSPKPSLREDISPPRYTANNEKCSESQSGSASGALRLAPFRTLTHALPVFMQVIYCKSMKPRLRSEASVPSMLILLRPCVEHYFSARTDFWFRVKLQ